MRYYDYFDAVALIDVLFEEAPSHPEYDLVFIEREYTDAEIQRAT